MPGMDFKRESLLTQSKRIWRENHGNWLLVTGLAVSAMAWVMGFYGLIPEISEARRQYPASGMPGKSLMVVITGCRSDAGQVVARLYDADSFGKDVEPLRSDALEIHRRAANWSIQNLPYGKYAAYAFQDIDGNGMCSPDLEPQGMTISHDPNGDGEISFANFAFEFTPTNTAVSVDLR